MVPRTLSASAGCPLHMSYCSCPKSSRRAISRPLRGQNKDVFVRQKLLYMLLMLIRHYITRISLKCPLLHCMDIPGQSLRKQLLDSRQSPRQSEPPYDGPLHSRVRCIVPLEQEAEQGVQADHSFQEPSTTER